GDAGLRAGVGELGILGEEAVPGMDGVDTDLLREADDAGDVEVRADRLAGLADAVRFVRLEAVEREAIFVRIDRDRANAELVGRAEHTDGNFTAIGSEELLELGRHPSEPLDASRRGEDTEGSAPGPTAPRDCG